MFRLSEYAALIAREGREGKRRTRQATEARKSQENDTAGLARLITACSAFLAWFRWNEVAGPGACWNGTMNSDACAGILIVMRDSLKEAIETLLNLPEDKQESAARAIFSVAREDEEIPVE
jgi:hypothetical protein